MPATTSRTRIEAKPYDRPAKGSQSKSKGKAYAAADSGAPAQHKQASRKGKKAWRKNVDLREEEEALERARAEERVTGGNVALRSNDDLFTVDTTGDVEVTKRMKREKKPLKSLAILNERSAVPALTARAKKSQDHEKNKAKLSGKEKARLRRTALKAEAEGNTVRGVSKTDTTSLHDAWQAAPADASLPGGFGDEAIVKRTVKAPQTLESAREVRRVAGKTMAEKELPRAGVSYNPAAGAHAALIQTAVEEELGRLTAEERAEAEIDARGGIIEALRAAPVDTDDVVGGMRVGRGDGEGEDDSEGEDDESTAFKPKPTKRKTQAQRNKAARAKAALLAEREEAARRKLERGIGAARTINKSEAARARAAEEAARQRKAAAAARELAGYTGGEKVGKHRVPKSSVAVQLGEDLAESLRQVKPEGNLFRDRFTALQRRALLEPRVPQLPKRRKTKVKEYEKHAWKKFE